MGAWLHPLLFCIYIMYPLTTVVLPYHRSGNFHVNNLCKIFHVLNFQGWSQSQNYLNSEIFPIYCSQTVDASLDVWRNSWAMFLITTCSLWFKWYFQMKALVVVLYFIFSPSHCPVCDYLHAVTQKLMRRYIYDSVALSCSNTSRYCMASHVIKWTRLPFSICIQ